MRIRTKSFAFCSILFCFILSLLSCSFDVPDIKNDEPVKEYFEHWTSTCQVGKLEYSTEHVTMGGVENLSAVNEVEINLYTINPQQLRLLCKEGQNGFCLQTEDGFVVSGADYRECMVDPSHIKINARLDDAHEGKMWTLSGCLWPENRTEFSLEDLRGQSPELFYSANFRQNTPPDNVKDLKVVKEPLDGKNAYLYFKLPDTQNLNRNTGSTYDVNYYLREADGQLHWKGRAELTLADNKNLAGGNEFFYCFPEQEASLSAYEYTVQVNGPHGLKSEFLSTDPSLGVLILVEPTITMVSAPNGKFDADNAEYECYEVASNDGTVSFTAAPGQEEDSLSVMVDNIPITATGGVYTVSGIGQHVISVTSSRVGARSVTVTKKITLVKTPDPAEFTFTPDFNGCEADLEGFTFIEVENAEDLVGFTITAPEAGTSLSVSIDGGIESGELTVPATGSLDVKRHTLVATVHKKNCNNVTTTKKVCILRSLDEPTITIVDTPNGKFDEDNAEYECYELASNDGTISFIADLGLEGDTLTVKVDGNPVTPTDGVYTVSGIAQHVITATASRAGARSVTATKKITLVKTPEAAVFAFEKDFNACEADADGYRFIEVDNANDLVGYTITAPEAGTSLSVTIDDGGDSGEVAGPVTGNLDVNRHTLVATVHKKNCNDLTLIKKVRILKSLEEPTFTIDNGTKTGSVSYSGHAYDKYEYSYLTYNNLKYTVTNPSANAGSTMTVKVDGSTVASPTSATLSDGYRIITIKVEKENLTPVEITKYVYVRIKRVCVTVGNISAYNSDGGKHVDLKGYFYAKTTQTSRVVLKAYTASKGTKVSKNHTITPDHHVLYMDSPSDYFYFYTSKIEDYDGGSDNDDLGTVTEGKTDSTRTLAALKADKHFHSYSSRSDRGHYEFYVTLSEIALPSITFSPDLNGCKDGSSSYEYIEVENSTDKVNYTITSQESGATLTGKVDGTSFSGNKTGQLDLGDHTIIVTVSKTGLVGATVTRCIRVVQELKEPSIKFTYGGSEVTSSGTPECGSSYLLYDAYDIALASNGSGSLSYAATPNSADTGASVVVVDNYGDSPVELSASGTLALGPHKLTLKVSKPGYRERETASEKMVFVQGILAAPTFTPVGTKISTDGDGTEHWQFSYKTYNEMPINVTPGNTGNTVKIYSDGSEVSKASIGHNTAGSITVVQTRDYCKRREDYSPWMSVTIKPITLTLNTLQVKLSGFEADSFNAKGIIYINTVAVWNHKDDQHGVTQGDFCTPGGTIGGWSGTYTEPSQTLYVKIEDFRRHRGGVTGDKPKFGDHTYSAISISDIKAAGWVYTESAAGGNGTTVQPKVTFSVSD